MTDMEDKIERVIELAAPVSRVWRAITDHEEFGQWFRVALDGPFRVGEVSTGQITYPGYEHLEWWARTERMEPERLFAMSWCPTVFEPGSDYENEPQTLVEFRLEPTEGGTRLTITESGFSTLPDADRLESFRRNSEGWDGQAKNIAAYVDG